MDNQIKMYTNKSSRDNRLLDADPRSATTNNNGRDHNEMHASLHDFYRNHA